MLFPLLATFSLLTNKVDLLFTSLNKLSFCKISFVIETLREEKINKLVSYKDLKSLSNSLSKKVYNYLKDLLPSSYLQHFSSAIGNRIASKKEDDSYVILSSDISDDFILDFWLNSNSPGNIIASLETQYFLLGHV
mgnify:CR=1 FL=1